MGMMSGASREVLSTMRRHAGRLVLLAVAPLLAMAATTLGAMWFMRGMFERMSVLATDPAAADDPRAVMPLIGNMIQMQGLILLGQIIVAACLVYMAVKAMRLHLTGGEDNAPWREVAKAGLYFFLYSLGIYFITAFAALLPSLLLAGMTGGLVYAILGSGEPNVASLVAAAVVAVPLILAVMLFPLWLGCRFAVGLPAVAMGKTPDMFRDFWPLARGASFGVPLRLFAAYLIMLLVIAPFAALAARQMYTAVLTLGPTPQPQQFFALQGEMFASLAWTLPAFALPVMVYMLFASLLLAEAYRRFTRAGRTDRIA